MARDYATLVVTESSAHFGAGGCRSGAAWRGLAACPEMGMTMPVCGAARGGRMMRPTLCAPKRDGLACCTFDTDLCFWRGLAARLLLQKRACGGGRRGVGWHWRGAGAALAGGVRRCCIYARRRLRCRLAGSKGGDAGPAAVTAGTAAHPLVHLNNVACELLACAVTRPSLLAAKRRGGLIP